jgi:1,4-alpha-glucan branching enzyme
VSDWRAGIEPGTIEALRHGDCADPHAILGVHPARHGRRAGHVIRAFHPEAESAQCRIGGELAPMEPLGGGLFAHFVPGPGPVPPYRVRFAFPGASFERADPYRFAPTLGEFDLHLFAEGRHRQLWRVLGANAREVDGVAGTAFAVWAPNARRVSLVGPFNGWDGRLLPMRSLGATGIFELFVPELGPGELYKYEIKTRDGALRVKADPFGAWMETPPATASRVFVSRHRFQDAAWMAKRPHDLGREPLSIYEVHLGSWARVPEEGNRPLGYREIAPRLAAHAKRFGFTHVELLPLAEHAFYGSWGYQVTGFYAPTARYGTPDDLRFLVDTLHQAGIGVILDWVPAHFPKDDFALRRFDGTALFEHEDPRRGEHPDWGTLIFNFGRTEVRNFLIANALYWLREFHIDGLRVDAVASMLYLDYSRKAGEWVPNREGGRENLEAIDFLREVNAAVAEEVPGAFTVAEESTAWGGVSRPPSEGGLGFSFKWNMGWMNDTLRYFGRAPVHRKFHQGDLSFAMVYEFSERFVNPLSHDEVVHGKGTLLGRMPGDDWQRFANLRALLAYQYTRPGKKLLFMGSELAPDREWNHDQSLDWHLEADPARQAFGRFLEALGRLYRETPCLWQGDPDPASFAWIDCNDAEHSVYAYLRRAGREHVCVVMNLTPVPREGYRVGVPEAVRYRERFSSDHPDFGGSGVATRSWVDPEPVAWHGQAQSVCLTLPPLGVLVLAPETQADGAREDSAAGAA